LAALIVTQAAPSTASAKTSFILLGRQGNSWQVVENVERLNSPG
jgi:hypothetical protein